MKTYLHSFLITSVLYISLLGFFIYQAKEMLLPKKEKQTYKSVCISIITKPEEILEEKPKKVEKKVEKEQVKKETEKIHPIVKKEFITLPKKTFEKPLEVAQEEPQTQTAEPLKPLESANPHGEKTPVTPIKEEPKNDLLKEKQALFLAHLIEKINNNKSYPNMARRRAIEGNVELSFEIFSDGSVHNITLIQGKKIFEQSAFEAISKSFPVHVESTLFDFPKEFKITLAYILH